ncbi:MAG: DUF1611 domain-containing protein [Candidatus Aminicenantaceae bacterium]
MPFFPEANAIVYCQGAFDTPNGKTAHGLVRRTNRYRVLVVIDSGMAGQDAGEYLDGRAKDIPIVADLHEALKTAARKNMKPTHFVIGLAPDGGLLDLEHHNVIRQAIRAGLNIDSGLHEFLSENAEFSRLAEESNVTIRDVRKPPHRSELHFFSGKIEDVRALKVALLGTDSAVGKRTTALALTEALSARGHPTELIGTGQTAWMQGVRYGIILDSLINDFVAGEIEHAVWAAWNEVHPDVIVIEGQGSLMNPAYPGGFEILAAGRPDIVIMQHAPSRKEYDGFPGYPLHPLPVQIQAVELLSGKPVIAVTINHESLPLSEIPAVCAGISQQTGLPAADLLVQPADKILEAVLGHMPPEEN